MAVSEKDVGPSTVVNKLVCEVSVPMHFLNDINIFIFSFDVCNHLGDIVQVALIFPVQQCQSKTFGVLC